MTTKRQKPAVIIIDNEQQANQTLAKVGQLNRAVQLLQDDMNEEIDKLKANYKAKVYPLATTIKGLDLQLGAFATNHKKELFADGKKSVEMTHGIIGFRKSTKIMAITKHTLADIIKKCHEHHRPEGIRIKESVNKEYLSQLGDEALSQLCAKKEVKDVFYYEIKEEDLKK